MTIDSHIRDSIAELARVEDVFESHTVCELYNQLLRLAASSARRAGWDDGRFDYELEQAKLKASSRREIAVAHDDMEP